MHNGRHIAEFYGVGALLAFSGGFLDAYTYISRDGVFANAQTGNIVLFGLNLSEGNFLRALTYLIPIVSFMLGVLVVEMLKAKFNEHPKVHWHQVILMIEMAVIAAVGFLPDSMNSAANVLVSLTCAMQVEAFRRMNGNPYATTMCTGNLRSGTDNLFQFISGGDKQKLKNALQYYGIILIFICGAGFGAVMTKALNTRASWICLISLCAALTVLKADEMSEKKGRDV